MKKKKRKQFDWKITFLLEKEDFDEENEEVLTEDLRKKEEESPLQCRI